jgi:hypothetical protein
MVPAREPWLNLALVVDTGPAMTIWHPLAGELLEALLRLGAFRDVRVWSLADLPDGVGIRASPGGPVVAPAALADPTGRQVVVVFSDCSSPHWWDGRVGPAVHFWAGHGPAAILQPLAERLWHRTAAPVVPGRAMLTRPAAPNSAMLFAAHDGRIRQRPGTVPVPVIELSADWLADWALLIKASAGPRDTAVTYLSGRIVPNEEPVSMEQDLPVADRLLRFQAVASPEATELAAHVAVSVPFLPVMQLIQQRVMPLSRPGDLAEVLLSGLLRPIDTVRGLYDFVPGARAALLKTLPRSETLATAEILRQVSDEIQARAGTAARSFEAVVRTAWGAGQQSPDPGEQPFALVSAEALRILSHTAIPLFAPAPPERPATRYASHADEATWYLMVEVLPYGPDVLRYLSRISLQRRNGRDEVARGRVVQAVDEPRLIGELPALLESALAAVWEMPPAEIDHLVIEFLLPFTLLGHPVDQWMVEADIIRHPVGIDHRVVVRCSDRRTSTYPRWREKSRLLREGRGGVRWVDPGEADDAGTRLYADLVIDGAACLALIRPPELASSLGGRDAVSIGLAAGVPVMVWCRDPGSASSFDSRLRAFLDRRGIMGLPDFVLDLRRDSVRSADPVGAHITLIWDPQDDSVLPVNRFQAPA